MSIPTTDYLDAIDHLPNGATLVFQDVTWDQYDELVRQITRRVRVSYDRGRLEVVSPRLEHEVYARLFDALLHVVADEFNFDLDGYGSTTWRREILQKGAEPDACYYVSSAKLLKDRLHIDLESDPPPDIVVEIDTTNDSSRKVSIYAALRVPEIWQYDGHTVRFYVVSSSSYTQVSVSRSIEGLRPALLEWGIERCKTQGQTAALREFRSKLQQSGLG